MNHLPRSFGVPARRGAIPIFIPLVIAGVAYLAAKYGPSEISEALVLMATWLWAMVEGFFAWLFDPARLVSLARLVVSTLEAFSHNVLPTELSNALDAMIGMVQGSTMAAIIRISFYIIDQGVSVSVLSGCFLLILAKWPAAFTLRAGIEIAKWIRGRG